MEKTRAKAKAETARRSNARKVKQQTDAEWKAEISRKLDGLSELSSMRKGIQRIAVALEKLAGIEGKDSDEKRISWPKSEGDETEVQERKGKGKQKEERIDGVEGEEETGGQEKKNGMEGMEEESSSFFLVAFSVGTGIL